MVLAAKDGILKKLELSELTSFNGCHRMAFSAMGTVNEIIFSHHSASRVKEYQHAVYEWLSTFEALYSVYIASSLVSEINRSAGKSAVAIDPMTEEILALCHWYHWKTRGMFDATSGPLINVWDYHRRRDALPAESEIECARALVGWEKVERTNGHVRLPCEGMQLNIGGIGKEYAVDQLVQLADLHGINNILVSLGRDIKCVGSPPEGSGWRVGLETPDAPERCWGGVNLDKMAICCSGHYARCFTHDGVRYSHLIHPRTGYPSRAECDAVWVVAPSCVEAGILATAAAMMDRTEALAFIDAEWNAQGCYWTKGARYETGGFAGYVIDKQNRLRPVAGRVHDDCAQPTQG